MDTSKDARFAEAIKLVEAALYLLDKADAPADIGARLADVVSRLHEYAASQGEIESIDAKGLSPDNDGRQ